MKNSLIISLIFKISGSIKKVCDNSYIFGFFTKNNDEKSKMKSSCFYKNLSKLYSKLDKIRYGLRNILKGSIFVNTIINIVYSIERKIILLCKQSILLRFIGNFFVLEEK